MDSKSEAPDQESVTILTTTDLETSEGKSILSNKINKEIDKIFGPAIQRNRSGSDIEIVGPFRRRHYWSQEQLYADKPLHARQVTESNISNPEVTSFQIDELKSLDESRNSQIPVLHENQRAEIVASVTERLYSKLKRNEKNIPKVESVLDRKAIQPLSELKICSNARQRLMELSQKALRNKRRIGIPAYTQTKSHVTRVKNQGIEIQTDLQSLVDLSQQNNYSLRKDASIQTESMTPRFRERAVGSNYDTVIHRSKDTSTQTFIASYKDSVTSTQRIYKYDHSTQTTSTPLKRAVNIIPALKRGISRISSLQAIHNDSNLSPLININISPVYSHESEGSSDSDSDIFTEEESEPLEEDILGFKGTTKDAEVSLQNKEYSVNENEFTSEFSDDEYQVLPRVVVDPVRDTAISDYEQLIIGRNKDTYPYNLKLSPCKNIDESKRVIKFEESEAMDAEGDDCIDTKISSTDTNLKLSVQGYKMNAVPDIEILNIESMQNNTDHNEKNKIQHNKEHKTCDVIKKYSQAKAEIGSPLLSPKELDTNDIELDACLYYSLNSFFKTRHKKRTPTEYLHYLIQKRREAISLESSICYRRNISF